MFLERNTPEMKRFKSIQYIISIWSNNKSRKIWRLLNHSGGRRDRMVVGFTTICVTSAYDH